jgi:hypothetical protein
MSKYIVEFDNECFLREHNSLNDAFKPNANGQSPSNVYRLDQVNLIEIRNLDNGDKYCKIKVL